MANPKKPEGYKQVSVWLPENLHKRLRIFRERQDLGSFDKAIATVIEQYIPPLEVENPPPPPTKESA